MAKIVIVEEDPPMREIYAAGLEKAGHEIRLLNNGAGIEKAVAEFDADAVVTDIVMQDVEGIETILTARKAFPALPIIAISGNPLYLTSAKKLGATEALKKPFTIEHLLNAIDNALLAGMSVSVAAGSTR